MESSTESTQTPPNAPFIPNISANELRQTYEMIVNSRKAILANEHWAGTECAAIGMLLGMLGAMEGQYRVQVELAQGREKADMKRAKEEIVAAGGKIDA